jgi:nicotinamide-nucleotide amidase
MLALDAQVLLHHGRVLGQGCVVHGAEGYNILARRRLGLYPWGMADDKALFVLSERVGQKLRAAGRRLATAESCTGGWVAKACTDIAGSSHWFECGYVTYSNAAKVRDIGVSESTLVSHGAVSEATVREMAAGALRVSGADIAVAISGIAGPDGGSPGKPVGTVWFALAVRRDAGTVVTAERQLFAGDRELVRRLSVERALQLVLGAG